MFRNTRVVLPSRGGQTPGPCHTSNDSEDPGTERTMRCGLDRACRWYSEFVSGGLRSGLDVGYRDVEGYPTRTIDLKIAGLPLVVAKLMSREKHPQFLGCEPSRSV
jgi:hypothetical protein